MRNAFQELLMAKHTLEGKLTASMSELAVSSCAIQFAEFFFV